MNSTVGAGADLPAPRDLLEQLPDAVVICTADGAVLYANPPARRVGIGPGDLHGAIGRARATGRRATFELQCRATRTWWQGAVYPVAQHLWVIARNTTADRHARRHLGVLAAASRAFADPSMDVGRLFGTIADAVARIVRDFCVVRLLSPDGSHFEAPIAAACVEGSVVERLEHLPPQPSDDGLNGRAVRQRRPQLIARFGPDDNISSFPPWHEAIDAIGLHSAMAAPLLAGDQVLGVIWVGRIAACSSEPFDQEDLALLEDLAGRAALALDRARAFARIRDSEQAARDSDRRKDEFLAMLGHELRNPLAPIVTATQLIRMSGADARIGKELDVIDRQVRHAMSLVDDLLDVSRITRGKVTLRKQAVELSRVVTDAVEQASPLIEQRRHNLSIEVPPRGLRVDADPSRLAQAVANLLTNAAKYTEPGGRLTVSAEQRDGTIVLAVRDTGAGIPAELLPQVFDLFVQGPRGLARGEGGLGLGLTIVRSVIELHGGSVEVSTEPGQGSEFRITLPVSSGLLAEPRSPAPATTVGDGSHRRVLVVDDNQDAAEVLAELLVTCGHEVRTAGDGPGALEVARELHPEVVLLDIGLPVMDGYEVARRLRQLEGGDQMRIVALTGYGQESDRDRSREAGFEMHLIKPIDLGELEPVLGPRGRRPAEPR